jgi:hypothetical protein
MEYSIPGMPAAVALAISSRSRALNSRARELEASLQGPSFIDEALLPGKHPMGTALSNPSLRAPSLYNTCLHIVCGLVWLKKTGVKEISGYLSGEPDNRPKKLSSI